MVDIDYYKSVVETQHDWEIFREEMKDLIKELEQERAENIPLDKPVIQTLKPLDFVKTPKGQIAIITETNDGGKQASIWFIGKQNLLGEKNAWWDVNELSIVDSLPHLIAICTAHPFGTGRKDVEQFFGKFV